MRLLCINPNTDRIITARVARALGEFLPRGTRLVEATGRTGAPYVATRATYTLAGHAALAAFVRHAGEDHDAVLVACFGDPALDAIRELADVPVIGMAEATCLAAAREPGRFSIVTGGHGWRAMLAEFVAHLGLADRLASIRTTEKSGGDLSHDPDAALDELAAEVDACRADGAERVILGGAGLAGFATRLRARATLPIIDCIEETALATLAAVEADRARGGHARPSPEAAAFAETGWL